MFDQNFDPDGCFSSFPGQKLSRIETILETQFEFRVSEPEIEAILEMNLSKNLCVLMQLCQSKWNVRTLKNSKI